MLCHDRRPHRIRWRLDRTRMRHGKEPPLLATLDRRWPRIGSRGLGMAFEVEHVPNAFPEGLAVVSFIDGHGSYFQLFFYYLTDGSAYGFTEVETLRDSSQTLKLVHVCLQRALDRYLLVKSIEERYNRAHRPRGA